MSDKETVKEVAKIYIRVMREEEKMVERAHSSSMLVKMLGLVRTSSTTSPVSPSSPGSVASRASTAAAGTR